MLTESDDSELEKECLWIEMAKKDPKSFEPLYNKYYEQIFRFLYRRTENVTLTSELCSQTFYNALAGIKRFKFQNKPFGAWLYTIATNELRKHFRNKPIHFIIELDKFRQIPDLAIKVDPREDLLIKVFETLSPDELRLVELRFFEDKGFKEISLLLKEKEGTIKMRLYRLLERMKTLMEEAYEKV